jgi:hypothetical protein
MKLQSKNTSLSAKAPSKINSEKGHQQVFWRRIGLRLAAIFLIIVFLASECAALLPVE